MLHSLKLRTKLAMIVAIPMIAALAIAVPGFRTRTHDLDAVSSARALLKPTTAVFAYLNAMQDEGSLSAWFVASGDPSLTPRIKAARARADRAARALPAAAREAAAHGAPEATERIRSLTDRVMIVDQERQFVDLRLTPDDAVLGYYRDLGSLTTSAIDGFVRAPRAAVAVTMFRDLATLARVENGAADERSILAVAYSRLVLPDQLASDLVAAVALQNASGATLEGQGRATTRAIVASGTRQFRSATDQVRQFRVTALNTRLLAFSVTPAQWYGSATRQMTGWGDIEQRVTRSVDTGLRARQDHARQVRWYYALGALVALLLAAGLAYLVARAIRRPLRQLADGARDVADRQLPALVDALHDDTVVPPTITPLTVRSRDELGALAKAFNHVERTTVEVADLQRQAVRSGISELYVSLARRNQPLLSRQLSLIEDLERDEREPDRLATLFTLDHLATRMRRNSDSLLVLAGEDDPLGDPSPVPLLDVVRGAVSETADFGRIDTAGIPAGVEIVGYAAPDLAHAVSELLENATEFSPPATRVVVVARRAGQGIELTISDEGIGIPSARLDALNQTLAKPPLPGLAPSRALGLIVVARLAHRIGVDVTLRSAPDVGTAAVLFLPDAILRTAGARGAADPASDTPLADTPVAETPAAADLTSAAAWVVLDDPIATGRVPSAAAADASDAGAVDIDLTADATSDPGVASDPATASADPWSRPGARPVEPAPAVDPPRLDADADADAEEIDLLPRRGRHHRRRRPRRGAGDAAGGTADALADAEPSALPPLLPPVLPGIAAAPVDLPADAPPPVGVAPTGATPAPPPLAPPAVPPVAPAEPPTADDGGAADDAITASGLPRRTPHAVGSREATLAAAPPPRPPDAVFELVARYEAGRRRAGVRPNDEPEDEQ